MLLNKHSKKEMTPQKASSGTRGKSCSLFSLDIGGDGLVPA